MVFWSIKFAAIFAQSDGIAQSARRPSGAFQSSGTFHGAGWVDREVFLGAAARPRQLSISSSIPSFCKACWKIFVSNTF